MIKTSLLGDVPAELIHQDDPGHATAGRERYTTLREASGSTLSP